MKRGSALLIVLGMVSFMVISAVAFSAYMRASRLPSSYLRRTSSSRHLVKAALAEAIDQIDIAIGNDPFPGMGDNGTTYASPRADTENESAYLARRNYWRNHCFIGTNRLVSADETVSTLTLEALAYLPPALINEARYYSRHSAAARWQSMGFDAGRFAFFAVDVSDHLDVNRIAANVGRNSSDNGRVSLAYVFENAAHTGYTVNPASWDAFMDNFVDAVDAYRHGGHLLPNSAKLALISLADLNLAIGYGGSSAYGCPSQVVSPFCRFVGSRGGQDFVTSNTGTDSEMMRSMAFVTDSYFPSSLGSGDDADYDLNDTDKQPFRATDLLQTTRSMTTALTYSSDGVTRLLESVCGLGLCALWDYLDEDSVPLSLAIPTTERVPMFAAVQPQLGNSQLKVSESKGTVEPTNPNLPDEALERTVRRTDVYSIDPKMFSYGLMGGKVDTLVTFPFRRDDDVNGTFKIGGRLALFFSDTAMAFHTDNANDVLHLGATSAFSEATVQNGVFYVPFQEQSLTFTGIDKEEDAVKQISLNFGSAANRVATWLNDNPMFKVTREWKQTRTKNEITGTLGPWLPEEPDSSAVLADPTECLVPPLKANGLVDTDYSAAANFRALVEKGGGKTVRLQMCVWLYAKDSNGKYVDLVPACIRDDDDLNSCMNFTTMGPDATLIGGAPYPLLRFGGVTVDYNPTTIAAATAAGSDFGFTTSAIMCADPRWNWAPEHWFVMPGGFSAQGWLDNCQRGNDGRDRDIFMATSDAGYLQSVYELAFLPRLTDLTSSGGNKIRGDMVSPANGATDFAANFSATPNNAFAWRTYRPFALPRAARDDFGGVGFTSEGTGFRVNPYADSDAPVLAALANTPYNWMVASTNTTGPNAIQESERKAEDFNRKYCFNQQGDSSSKFAWDDLKSIAANIRSAVRSRSDGDWKAAFDALDWAGLNSADELAGVTLSGETCDLTDADRKFLYGFWRDSFAAKQQLFLVFVRAEPLMMGGGAIGQTPPQLGARAVALVWRDPAKTQTDVGAGQPRPHRTRILFYRQFD